MTTVKFLPAGCPAIAASLQLSAKTLRLSLMLVLSMGFATLTAFADEFDFTGSKVIDNGETMSLIIKCQPAFAMQADDRLELLCPYEFLEATIETTSPIEEFGSGGGCLRMVATAPFSITAAGIEIRVKNFTKYSTEETATLLMPNWESYVIPLEQGKGNAIAPVDPGNSIAVYPNPVQGELKIENGGLSIEKVEIFDIFGRNAGINLPVCPNAPEIGINITHLPPGIYFVKIAAATGEVIKKIVKK